MDKVEVFKIGKSQAVRLPRRYSFTGSEVAIRKKGNNVILSPISKKGALEAFLALPCCPDFAITRDDAPRSAYDRKNARACSAINSSEMGCFPKQPNTSKPS